MSKRAELQLGILTVREVKKRRASGEGGAVTFIEKPCDDEVLIGD